MLCRGLTPERMCVREGAMAVRLWGSSMQGLSLVGLPRVRASCKLLGRFSAATAIVAAPTQVRTYANSAALEEVNVDSAGRKRERLSRQERTALVESFVLKHMDSNHGAFPSVSTVLKGTGGGRNVVRDILSDLEMRFSSKHLTQTAPDNAGGGKAVSRNLDKKMKSIALSAEQAVGEGNDDLQEQCPTVVDVSPLEIVKEGMGAEVKEHRNTGKNDQEVRGSSSGRQEEAVVEAAEHHLGQQLSNGVVHDSLSQTAAEDMVTEVKEYHTTGVNGQGVGGESSGRVEIETKTLTLTNGQMMGASHGEIETHSGLWSRLRRMGTNQPLKQGPTQQSGHEKVHATFTRTGSQRSKKLGGQGFPESDSIIENYGFPDSSALGTSNGPENDSRNILQSTGSRESSLGTGAGARKGTEWDKHGLFVRYLLPEATADDMREAFADCGEIVRAQAIKNRSKAKFTYGFVDFKTALGLKNALEKDRVYIKGVRIQKEPSSSTRNTIDRVLPAGTWAGDLRTSRISGQNSSSSLNGSSIEPSKRIGYMVIVDGIPMHIPVTEVQKVLSKHGAIVQSEMRKDDSGAYSAYLEFEADEARESALMEKSVQLSGMQYSILRADPLKTSVVRLTNVGLKANEVHISATCRLFGRVEKVVARCESMVDVYFHSSEMDNMPRILSRLNEVTMEGRRWQAQPASRMLPGSCETLLSTRDGQEWVQLQSERLLNKVESAMKKLAVDVEDLQELVRANREHITLVDKNGISSPTTLF